MSSSPRARRCIPRCARRGVAVELPVRDPGGWRARRSGRRQRRDPEAAARDATHRAAARRSTPPRRGAADVVQFVGMSRQRGRSALDHASRCRFGGLTGAVRDRAHVPVVEAGDASPRRDQRQERHRRSPRRRTSIWRSVIWSARRSVMPARSARRPAWRSSRHRCTTIPRSWSGWRDADAEPRRRPAVAGRQRRRPVDRVAVAEAATRPDTNSTPASVGSSSRVISAATCGRRACESACGRARGSTSPSASDRCSA